MSERLEDRRIYWCDFLVSTLLGWGAFAAALSQHRGSLAHIALLSATVFLLFRGLAFLHELTHHARSVPGMETAWNLLLGIPIGVPSLMYMWTHLDHHRPGIYATQRDPEYAPLSTWSRGRTILFVLGSVFIPALLCLRWAILTPLSAAIPRLRRWVVEKGSTLAINPDYTRPHPGPEEKRAWAWQEPLAALYFWGIAVAVYSGALPLAAVEQWFVVLGAIFFLNQVRTLAAHRYLPHEESADQLRDSINLVASPIYALIAPLGFRLHALHHWRPALPYHEMSRVHAELTRSDTDAAYAASSEISMRDALRDLRSLE